MNDEQVPDEVELALRARLKILQQEHADLEASIEALGHMPIPDQLLLGNLLLKIPPGAFAFTARNLLCCLL